MSYIRRLTGSFEVRPGIPWGLYRHLDQMGPETQRLFEIVEDTAKYDRGEGQLLMRSMIGIRPRREEAYDHPEAELRELVDLARHNGATVTGTIYSVGEDGPLDTWRYYTVHDVLVADQAILVWPAGNRAYQAVPRSTIPGQETLRGDCLVLGDDGPVAWPTPIDKARIIMGAPWQR
jgi:hypothetical protein